MFITFNMICCMINKSWEVAVNLPIFDAYTVVNIWTVVIKLSDTSITDPTVFGTKWLHCSTRVTQST